jgi:hypothetical protein
MGDRLCRHIDWIYDSKSAVVGRDVVLRVVQREPGAYIQSEELPVRPDVVQAVAGNWQVKPRRPEPTCPRIVAIVAFSTGVG